MTECCYLVVCRHAAASAITRERTLFHKLVSTLGGCVSDIVNTDSDSVFAARELGVEDRQPGAGADEGGRVEREGLPRTYRMRADRHYVDQLSSRSAGHPVRIIPLEQFAALDPLRETDLGPLLQSVRALGIVHPLLVRRAGSAYTVVAGRKRLAAAQILRLPAVPCLVHDVDDAEASAMARADNLALGGDADRADTTALDAAVRRAIAEHLTTVRLCANVLSGDGPMKRSALDLSAAHTWRASRLLDALELIANRPALPTRDRPLPALVDEVVSGFATEARMSGFTVRAEFGGGASSAGINGHDIIGGLSGALMAVIPLVESAADGVIVLSIASASDGATVFHITPGPAPVPTGLARRFFDEISHDRPGGWPAAAGALAAKAFAERHRGSASFDVAADGRGSIRIRVPHAS